MKGGGCVGAGAQPQDPAVHLAEMVERRARAVIIVPGGVLEQDFRVGATRAEAAGRVVGHDRARAALKRVGEIADLVEHGRGMGIEGWRAVKEGRALLLGPLIDPIMRDLCAKDHEQRAVRAHRPLKRIEDGVSAADHGAERAQRRVDHQRVSGTHAEGA